MKEYPTINRVVQSKPIYAFDKLDGSNIRAEWTRKRGFYKFGKRNGLLDDSNPILKKSPDLIMGLYGSALNALFLDKRLDDALVFFEFHGTNSFAGSHDPNDNHTVTLFDISVYKKGILTPNIFLDWVKEADVPCASLLYQGIANQDFIRQVKTGTLPGMTFEGVVCKGGCVSPGLPLMFKVKSDAWIEKLKTHCKGNEILFNQLL